MMVTRLWVLLFYYIWFSTTSAVNPACECLIFEASFTRDFGVFTSPNFPSPYETNINCLLYTFVGNEDEIVQLTFDDFDVHKTELECVFGDFLKMFFHLPKPDVNEHTPSDLIICGTIDDISREYYSSGPNLVFEFHSDWRNGTSTGFRGKYHFINKRSFQTNGQLIEESKCDYQFNSSNKLLTRGHFFSPRYPSYYPTNVRCAYNFIGKVNERVKLVFENISLQQGDDSCLDTPDGIVIRDGVDNNYPVIEQFCHISTMQEIISTGPSLYVEFISKSGTTTGRGFKASYSFEEGSGTPGFSFGASSIEPERSIKERGPKAEKNAPVPKSIASCDHIFSSDITKTGNFTSPDYPSPYPARINCRYTFIGHGKERVQIIFTEFDLYKPFEEAKDCEGVDAVIAFIQINGMPERIDNFCGKQLPIQLMSNGQLMFVEFRSYQSSSLSKGFKATYKFVSDFGISSGKQDNQSVCGFVFNSSASINGTFATPNFPGYYPRNTECHYFFYGEPKERVKVKFIKFDVEGILPCTMTTASDYVEFSNYDSVDRKMQRHCGLRVPHPMESERNFFRVTFRSNYRFDATGFEASYQFVKYDDETTIMRVASSSSTRADNIVCCIVILAILFSNFFLGVLR
ncbi:hypothetical protein CHUAL_007818 [Chamberlinius hualienensis]